MLDLSQFCAADVRLVPGRPYLCRPFTQGDYTYATDTCIIVRVPRNPVFGLVAEVPIWTLAERFAKADVATFVPLHIAETRVARYPGTSAVLEHEHRIGEEWFDDYYIAKLLNLPGIQVVAPTFRGDPMPFKFEGGSGLLMGLRGEPMRKGEEAARKAA